MGQSSDPKLPDLKKVQKFFPQAEAVAKVRKKGKQYFTAYFSTRAQALHDRLTCARKMAARKTDKLIIDYLDSGTVEEGAWKARDMDDQLVIVGFSGDCSEAEIKREVVKAFREAIGASNSGTSYEEMGGPISVIHDASKDIYWVKWNLFGAYLFKAHAGKTEPDIGRPWL